MDPVPVRQSIARTLHAFVRCVERLHAGEPAVVAEAARVLVDRVRARAGAAEVHAQVEQLFQLLAGAPTPTLKDPHVFPHVSHTILARFESRTQRAALVSVDAAQRRILAQRPELAVLREPALLAESAALARQVPWLPPNVPVPPPLEVLHLNLLYTVPGLGRGPKTGTLWRSVNTPVRAPEVSRRPQLLLDNMALALAHGERDAVVTPADVAMSVGTPMALLALAASGAVPWVKAGGGRGAATEPDPVVMDVATQWIAASPSLLDYLDQLRTQADLPATVTSPTLLAGLLALAIDLPLVEAVAPMAAAPPASAAPTVIDDLVVAMVVNELFAYLVATLVDLILPRRPSQPDAAVRQAQEAARPFWAELESEPAASGVTALHQLLGEAVAAATGIGGVPSHPSSWLRAVWPDLNMSRLAVLQLLGHGRLYQRLLQDTPLATAALAENMDVPAVALALQRTLAARHLVVDRKSVV